MPKSKIIDPVDLALGTRIRTRREALGVTQAQLAAASKVTFQQIQKYERGVNRVSAARLALIAQFLKAHPADFYGDVVSDKAGPFDQLARTHDGVELANCYLTMTNEHRLSLMSVARAFAAPAGVHQARLAA